MFPVINSSIFFINFKAFSCSLKTSILYNNKTWSLHQLNGTFQKVKIKVFLFVREIFALYIFLSFKFFNSIFHFMYDLSAFLICSPDGTPPGFLKKLGLGM